MSEREVVELLQARLRRYLEALEDIKRMADLAIGRARKNENLKAIATRAEMALKL